MENLGIIISIGFGVFSIIGVTISMMLWVRGEANADRRDIFNLIVAIKDEIKDFHLRLEKQDSDFKSSILEIQRSGPPQKYGRYGQEKS